MMKRADMKKQCDEKRMTYEVMKTQYEKGRSKSCKGESVSSRQLQSAQDEFDKDATLYILLVESLKRGQSHRLLTQAARHHAAQICFFRKALKSLEAIEPQVKLTSEQKHIDYYFSGLEVDDRNSVFLTDDEDDSDDYYETLEDGELNFDFHRKDRTNEVSSSGNSMELDNEDPTFPQVASVNLAKENMYRKPFWSSTTFDIDLNTGSKSAPLSAESTFDPNERFKQMRQSSTRKLNTYVLPTPLEKRPVTSGNENRRPQPRPTTNTWHSSPLEHKKYEKILRKENFSNFSGPIVSSEQSVQKESNNDGRPTALPTPQTELPSSTQVDSSSISSAKKMKRYAFSGPLTDDSQSHKPLLSASGPLGSTAHHRLFSGSLLQATQPLSTSKVSSQSARFVSSPIISELHELPRPPANLASMKTSKVGFSSPLVTIKGGPDLTDTHKLPAYTLQ